jgi:hypothetical protein
MTRENAKKLLPIITAYAEGKTIQVLLNPEGWTDSIGGLGFDSPPELYRIKPEPRIFDAFIRSDGQHLTNNPMFSDHLKFTPIKLQEIID